MSLLSHMHNISYIISLDHDYNDLRGFIKCLYFKRNLCIDKADFDKIRYNSMIYNNNIKNGS